MFNLWLEGMGTAKDTDAAGSGCNGETVGQLSIQKEGCEMSKGKEAKFNLPGVSVNSNAKPPRITIYGPPKVGKSTFGAMAPDPIFLSTEDGLGEMEGIPHFEGSDGGPKLLSYDEVTNAIGILWEHDHDRKTVVLDSADWLETLIWKKVAQDQGKASIEDIGYAKGYIFALDYWRQILDGLNALRVHKNMMPIIICHSQVKTFNNPMSDPYDRFSMKLHEKARAMVEEWSDCIFFAGYKVHTKKVDAKGGDNSAKGTAKVTRGIGGGERLLFTSDTPAFVAGSRYNLPPELPLDFNEFMAALASK